MQFVVVGFVILQLALYAYCNHLPPNTGSVTDAKNLRKQLFETNEYDKRIKPRMNQSDIVYVRLSLNLLSIIELSEVTESLKSTAFLSISWYDDFLQWNYSDYRISYYPWPQVHIWRPDVVLKNSFIDYKELGIDTLNVEVFSDGAIWWFLFQIFQSTCTVDITYFPFDTQNCQLKFVAWSYSADDVILQNVSDPVSLKSYQSNPEWNIIDTSCSTTNVSAVSVISFNLKLKRKPQYIMLSVIMPITMLALLNISVFILPCDSGEKGSYAITVFLAFAVFLTIVSSTLPQSSDSVAIFSVFLMILTTQSTMITFIALVMIRCNLFDDDITPVPSCIQSFLRLLSFQPCLQKFRRGVVTPTMHYDKPAVVTSVQMEGSHGHHMKDQEMVNDDRMGEEDTRSLKELFKSSRQIYTWKQAVNQLDRIFFLLFLTVLILSVVLCGLSAFE